LPPKIGWVFHAGIGLARQYSVFASAKQPVLPNDMVPVAGDMNHLPLYK
jgi:hypothetical protein